MVPGKETSSFWKYPRQSKMDVAHSSLFGQNNNKKKTTKGIWSQICHHAQKEGITFSCPHFIGGRRNQLRSPGGGRTLAPCLVRPEALVETHHTTWPMVTTCPRLLRTQGVPRAQDLQF